MTVDLQAREAGSGRPVVLLHPFPVDGAVYDAQLEAARDGRLPARLIAPDFPGFGQTPVPDPVPDILSVHDLAAWVRRFMESARLDRPIVGGAAIGGYVAIEVARRFPDQVTGLILMGCKAAPDAPANRPMREATAARAREHGSAGVADTHAAAPLGPGATDEHRAAMRRMIHRANPEMIASLVMGLHERPDPTPALASLDLPILLITGEKDPFTKVEEARRTAALLKHGTYVELPGVGHISPMEAPDAVTEAVAAFVARVSSAA